MTGSLLVAYATRYGSTQKVAEAVAATLREQRGLTVDLEPMRQVRALDQYRAVVLGAPLTFMRMSRSSRAPAASSTKELAKFPWLSM